MKTTVITVMLVATFRIALLAQTVAHPPVSYVSSHLSAPTSRGAGESFQLPANTANLVFYGGDTNPSDPNVQGFANGNTLLAPNTTTYGAVKASSRVVASGILFNQIPTITGNVFDPATANYDIRIGVRSGNGGKDLASGSGPQSVIPTGRSPLGFTEFGTSVAFTKPLAAAAGTTYFINLSSQCTDANNSNCSSLQYFADNTTQQTNGINQNLQPPNDMFFNSAFFGFTWTNWCDPSLGQNSQQCEWLSFGIYGPGTPPAVVFYSGDFNPSNTNANALLSQNIAGEDGAVWVPFAVQKQITVNYLFVNELFNSPPPASAPAQWAISNGVAEGTGGKLQCSGSGTALATPTGRSFTAQSTTYNEYQYIVALAQPCILSSTASGSQNGPPTKGGCPGGCSLNLLIQSGPAGAPGVQGFLSDVEDDPPINHVGLPNINDDSFFTSSAFGFNFSPTAVEQGGVCGLGLPVSLTNVGCDMFSVGIIGSGQ